METGVDIPLNVANDLPVDIVTDAATKAGRKKADDIDKAIFGIMIAGATAGNTIAKGTNANFIPLTGIEATSAARPFVFDAMWDIWLAASTSNVATAASENDGQRLTFTMAPYLFRQLQGFLRRDGNADAIAQRSIESGGGYSYLGLFDIRLTNDAAIKTSVVSSNNVGVILASTTAATTFAEKPNVIQVLSPSGKPGRPVLAIERHVRIRRAGRRHDAALARELPAGRLGDAPRSENRTGPD